MSESLRRACHACHKAKRKCNIKLPACDRCAIKGLQCTYSLEPVVHHNTEKSIPDTLDPTKEYGPLHIVYPTVEAARQASIAAVAEGHPTTSPATRPLLMSDAKLAEFLVSAFSDVARAGLAGTASPFVHPVVFRRELSIYHTQVPAREHPAYTTLERLVEIQELITNSLRRLLLDRAPVKNDEQVERLVTRLFTATRELWEVVPQEVGATLCPFEAWVVGESIRRSMFAAVHIRGFWWVATQGFVHYEPFFESLPFDPRADLWATGTELTWLEAVARNGGRSTKLVSYHEFITSCQGVLPQKQDALFQRILFVCYYGSPGIAQLTDP